MYWSRTVLLYQTHNGSLPHQTGRIESGPTLGKQYDTLESIVLSKPTLLSRWQLYLVLAIQPFLTICAFAGTVFLYKAPLHRGFGIVSILAGIKPASLALLDGAGLSGQLDKALTLNIEVAGDQVGNQQIQYSIDHGAEATKVRLNRGEMYS